MPHKFIRVEDVFGNEFPLDICSLNTSRYIKLIGGTLLINDLNDHIPPISCTHKMCSELADYLAVAVSTRGEESDSSCYLCSEHLEEVIHLGELEVPYEIVH